MVVEQLEDANGHETGTVLYNICPRHRSCIDGAYMLMVEGRMRSRSGVGDDGSRKRSRQRWMALSSNEGGERLGSVERRTDTAPLLPKDHRSRTCQRRHFVDAKGRRSDEERCSGNSRTLSVGRQLFLPLLPLMARRIVKIGVFVDPSCGVHHGCRRWAGVKGTTDIVRQKNRKR